jgi:uncharacterized protein
MIIDVHHHLSTDPADWDKLAAECERLGIVKVCGFGPDCENASKAMAAHPDLMVGFGYFGLGQDSVEAIDDYVARGFKGVKFIRPAKNYDDKAYYPIYARMESHGLIALFHLGIVGRSPRDRELDVNNSRHRPIYLDTLARAFPGMQILGAHFGNPWYDEAAMSARWNPNLYFDLSGSTLKKKSARFLGDLLWWRSDTRYRDPEGRHAWEKIVFGSDVPVHEIGDVLNDYRNVMTELDLPDEVQQKVLGGTMAGILGLAP